MTVHLHSPEGVARFQRAIADVPTATLFEAMRDLDRFRDRSYFEGGDPAPFTRAEIAYVIEQRARQAPPRFANITRYSRDELRRMT